MLIKEACKMTKLTKKAVEYYIEKDLVHPTILEKGYRDFNTEDVNRLKKIAILRKLGLGTDDIKIILSDESGQALQEISTQRELRLDREKIKQLILDKLSSGKDWDEINNELKVVEQSKTITERLLDAFPGYYGRFISLHFSRFLNEVITAPQQQEAYDNILNFLDNTPPLEFPKEVEAFLVENTKHISTQVILDMAENTKKSIENPEKFLAENKEMLSQYLAYKQSDEYRSSPVYKIQSMLKEFNSSSGYYDVFIPAMKKLSPSYKDYYKQLEIANEKLLSEYPEIEEL